MLTILIINNTPLTPSTAIASIVIARAVTRKTRQWAGTYRPDAKEEQDFLQREVLPLRYYPVAYLLVSVFGVANRIQNAIAPASPVLALFVLHSLTFPLQGMIYSLIYAHTTGLLKSFSRTGVRQALRRMQLRVASPEPYKIEDDRELLLGAADRKDSVNSDDSED